MQLELSFSNQIEILPDENGVISPTLGKLLFIPTHSDDTLHTCKMCALRNIRTECAQVKICVTPGRKDKSHGYFKKS